MIVDIKIEQLKSASFSYSRFGCCDTLSFVYPFQDEIFVGDIIYLTVKGKVIWTGYVNNMSFSRKERNVSVNCQGLSKMLANIEVSQRTFQQTEISDIVKDIVEYCCEKEGVIINFDGSFFDKTGLNIDFAMKAQTASDVIHTLALIAGSGGESYSGESLAWDWGVDEGRNFYFIERSNDIKKVISVGSNVEEYDTEITIDELKTVVKIYGSENNVYVYKAQQDILDRFGYREISIMNNLITSEIIADMYGMSILKEVCTPKTQASITVIWNDDIMKAGGKIMILDGSKEAVYSIERVEYSVSNGMMIKANMVLGRARNNMNTLWKRFLYEINMQKYKMKEMFY